MKNKCNVKWPINIWSTRTPIHTHVQIRPSHPFAAIGPTHPPSTHPPAPWPTGNVVQINRLMITKSEPFMRINEKTPLMRKIFDWYPSQSKCNSRSKMLTSWCVLKVKLRFARACAALSVTSADWPCALSWTMHRDKFSIDGFAWQSVKRKLIPMDFVRS